MRFMPFASRNRVFKYFRVTASPACIDSTGEQSNGSLKSVGAENQSALSAMIRLVRCRASPPSERYL